MFKAAIFDLDGTVLDTVESIATAGNRMLEALGMQPFPIENYKYYAGDGADTLVRRALKEAGDTGLAHFEEGLRIYREFFKTDCNYHVRAFPGMKETLQVMKEQGMKLGIVSNKPNQAALDVVAEFYGNLFDAVLGHREDIPKKPNPAGTLQMARDFGVTPEQCIYVGDTNTDMQTGKGAGMYTVGVLWGFRDRKELEENHADVIIERPEELLEIMQGK